MRTATATTAVALTFASLVAAVPAATAAPAAPSSDRSVFRSALKEVWFGYSPRKQARFCRAYRAAPADFVIAIIRPSVEAGYIDRYAAARVTVKFLYSQCGSVA